MLLINTCLYSTTNLAMEGNMEINPSEAAVLNCMIQARGTSLSLKVQ